MKLASRFTILVGVINKLSPVVIFLEKGRISNDDHQRLGSGDCHVKPKRQFIIYIFLIAIYCTSFLPFGILEKSQFVLNVRLEKLFLRSDGGNDDHASLLSLELLRGSNGDPFPIQICSLEFIVQTLPDFLHLSPVGSDNSDVFSSKLRKNVKKSVFLSFRLSTKDYLHFPWS